MAGGYDGSIRIDTKIDGAGFNNGIKAIGTGISRLTTSLKGLAAAVGVAFSIGALISFGQAAVKASTDLSNAMLGLQSIVEGQGRSFATAQRFIQDYISDGLIPATNAVAAYKNLAARGYGDDQITQTMLELKDAAAFGRQASLSLGEAVQSATEGLKNENSILVDNAGVTKNVAKMWEDYARSIGTTANDLTKQQKIQAEVTGIMEETRFQTGDAAKLADTYSGAVLRMGYGFNNLKVAAGNALIPLAAAALPGLNALITALTRIFNLLAKVTTALFGKQSSTNPVANAASNIAKSSNAAAEGQKNLAKSTKAASKEAKKSTEVFDELNIIKPVDTGGSGGGSAGGIAGGDVTLPTVGGELGGDVTVSPAVQAAVDKIKELLKPLQEINFDPLKQAFSTLWSSVKPLISDIGKGLEWFWDNVLVPFAKWRIESAGPADIKLWAAVFDVLRSVIETLAPLALGLWNNFLKPIAAWTGGVIVSVIEGLARALTAVSDWIKNHQTIVEGIIIILGSFAAAWGIVTIAIGISTGTLGIWTTVTTIAAGATSIFNQALTFLTGPMAPIVLAITAIIAVVVLLIKNWDKVKAVAIACWNKIKEVWAIVAGWINDNVIKPIVGFFTGLWNSITGIFSSIGTWFSNIFTGAWNGIKTAFSEVVGFFAGIWTGIQNAFSHVTDWFKNVFTTAWTAVKKVFEAGGKIFDGIKDGIVTAFKAVVNAIIAGINKVIALPFNAINSVLNGIRSVNILGIRPFSWVGTIKVPQIPQLAQGAVIPPNKKFLAYLGDQTSGRNLEAPESLIRQIVREEAGKGSGPLSITVQMGTAKLGTVVLDALNDIVKQGGELNLNLG